MNIESILHFHIQFIIIIHISIIIYFSHWIIIIIRDIKCKLALENEFKYILNKDKRKKFRIFYFIRNKSLLN